MSKTNNTPKYWKRPEEVALLLSLRGARTEKGRKVQAAVLARVEIAMAIAAVLAQ